MNGDEDSCGVMVTRANISNDEDASHTVIRVLCNDGLRIFGILYEYLAKQEASVVKARLESERASSLVTNVLHVLDSRSNSKLSTRGCELLRQGLQQLLQHSTGSCTPMESFEGQSHEPQLPAQDLDAPVSAFQDSLDTSSKYDDFRQPGARTRGCTVQHVSLENDLRAGTTTMRVALPASSSRCLLTTVSNVLNGLDVTVVETKMKTEDAVAEGIFKLKDATTGAQVAESELAELQERLMHAIYGQRGFTTRAETGQREPPCGRDDVGAEEHPPSAEDAAAAAPGVLCGAVQVGRAVGKAAKSMRMRDLRCKPGQLLDEVKGRTGPAAKKAMTGFIQRTGDSTLMQNMKVPVCTAGAGVCVMSLPLLAVLAAPLLWAIGAVLVCSGMYHAALVLAPSRDARHVVDPQTQARVPPGTFRDLAIAATSGAQSLTLQVGDVIQKSVRRARQDVSGEVEVHLRQLQVDVGHWIQANENLRTYSDGEIGWLLREHPARDATRDVTEEFFLTFDGLPAAHEPLTRAVLDTLPLPGEHCWDDLIFLLVPGLLTKWYPLYMASLKHDLKRLRLQFYYSRVDTEQSVRVNAGRLRDEVHELVDANPGKRVVLFGHSKAAVDIAAALSIYPELVQTVAAMVSLQGPHGGAAIVNDLVKTSFQKSLALGVLERLLRGSKHALIDLSYASRRAFWASHSYPLQKVPTICLATCERRSCTLLKPTVDYINLRYGELSDGLVCTQDQILPGALVVNLSNMDHFGPAWGSFPATDPYDPARLYLSLLAVALRRTSHAKPM
ncbi:hypothetical protein CYMTET_6045 [Cymbomonas tetramitiformis]|uniref:Uncharacterized protein n=1 Tax=Cymbomonas tetramitiformis TaxID=36881 RepID=A0AAE0LIT7_9CHLO|nr:hypothetical protein CYMTET_6045 [Cymbomonas tetramitiformis]